MPKKFILIVTIALAEVMFLTYPIQTVKERQLIYKPTKTLSILMAKPVIKEEEVIIPVPATSVPVVKLANTITPISLNSSEVALLARLIQAESLSESYEGKLWVGSVVINRMRVYNKSMKTIIFEKYQFAGTQGRLFNIEPSKECIQAATDVLSGNLRSKEVLYFVDLHLCNPSWIKDVVRITKIGTHTFYKEK